MCGVPGSGKSTYLKNNVIENEYTTIISRDKIRFSIVKPDEPYFSHEDEVCEKFWTAINEALAADKTVWVDQTSLTPKARKWLLQHIKGYEHANIVWIDEDLETCLKRNELRRGTRAYVPRDTIRRMYSQFIKPSLDEGFDNIYYYSSKIDTDEFKEWWQPIYQYSEYGKYVSNISHYRPNCGANLREGDIK